MSSKYIATGLGLGGLGFTSYLLGIPLSNPFKSATPEGNGNKVSVPAPVLPAGPPALPVRPQEFFKYGFPGPLHDMLTRQEFVSCYDRQKRNPYWIVEHITAQSLQNTDGTDRKRLVFREDESVPPKFRALLRDYFRSGYDRGHLAPAADAKFNQNAMNETFFLTNMSPQIGDGFNRNYWAHFEDFARRLTKLYRDVRIMTGPLFLPKLCDDGKYRVSYEVIGNPPNVAVPTHFFKLIVCENPGSSDVSVAAFVLPNDVIPDQKPLISFQVPVEALERSSGLELLTKVPLTLQRDLCKEVKCEIIVREFPKQVDKVLALPKPK